MSGNIKVKTRVGISLDRRYAYYPEAVLEITGEDGKKVILSPRYQDLCRMLIDFRKHELKIDYHRNRKHYTSKLISQLQELLNRLKQIEITELENIEEIYTLNHKFKSFKEAKEYFKCK